MRDNRGVGLKSCSGQALNEKEKKIMHESKQQTNLRYIDEFLRLSSAPMMLELKLFPNSKEISESMAMWEVILPLSINTELMYPSKEFHSS